MLCIERIELQVYTCIIYDFVVLAADNLHVPALQWSQSPRTLLAEHCVYNNELV